MDVFHKISSLTESSIKEIIYMNNFDHPNILKICDVIRDLTFTIMKCEKDLFNVKMENRQFIDFIYQITSAIEHIHSFGIVHSDIKPQNIVHQGNKYFLIDYGISNFESGYPYKTSRYFDRGLSDKYDFINDYGNLSLTCQYLVKNQNDNTCAMINLLSRGIDPFPRVNQWSDVNPCVKIDYHETYITPNLYMESVKNIIYIYNTFTSKPSINTLLTMVQVLRLIISSSLNIDIDICIILSLYFGSIISFHCFLDVNDLLKFINKCTRDQFDHYVYKVLMTIKPKLILYQRFISNNVHDNSILAHILIDDGFHQSNTLTLEEISNKIMNDFSSVDLRVEDSKIELDYLVFHKLRKLL